MIVVMGRKTYEAVDKPLPGRVNIVITRQPDWKKEGTITSTELNEALTIAEETHFKEVFVIGGGEIYKQAMTTADKIYITRVHATLEGDTFFPVINESEWKLVSNEDFDKDAKHQYSYSFQLWERK